MKQVETGKYLMSAPTLFDLLPLGVRNTNLQNEKDELGRKQMYYFSEQFLAGLQTKSEGFQDKFYGIIDEIDTYIDEEVSRMLFHKHIETQHTYDKPGNMLYSSKLYCGSGYSESELKEKINFFLLGLFDDFGASEAMEEVPHIIVCISAPDGYFTDEDTKLIRNLLFLERTLRSCPPVAVTTVFCDTSKDRGVSCFVACLK